MLSTIVLFEEKPAKLGNETRVEGLVRTLASLVAPNIEGVLGDVTIFGPAGYSLDRIAEHAGCGLIEAKEMDQGFRPAFENLRYEQFLLLRAGYALKADFIEEVDDLVRLNRQAPVPVAKLLSEPESFVQRLYPGAAEIVGLIAPKSWGLGQSCRSMSTLIRNRHISKALRTRARRTI